MRAGSATVLSDDPLRFALRHGAAARVRARGVSMRPFFPDGCVVHVVPRRGPLRVGDVVLTDAAPRLVLHRVVALETAPDGTGLVHTHGDGRRRPDLPVPETAVLGRVIAVEVAGVPVGLEGALGAAVAWLATRVVPRLRAARWLVRNTWLVRRQAGARQVRPEVRT